MSSRKKTSKLKEKETEWQERIVILINYGHTTIISLI